MLPRHNDVFCETKYEKKKNIWKYRYVPIRSALPNRGTPPPPPQVSLHIDME